MLNTIIYLTVNMTRSTYLPMHKTLPLRLAGSDGIKTKNSQLLLQFGLVRFYRCAGDPAPLNYCVPTRHISARLNASAINARPALKKKCSGPAISPDESKNTAPFSACTSKYWTLNVKHSRRKRRRPQPPPGLVAAAVAPRPRSCRETSLFSEKNCYPLTPFLSHLPYHSGVCWHSPSARAVRAWSRRGASRRSRRG